MAIADAVIPSIQVSSIPSSGSLCLPPYEYSSAVETIDRRLPVDTEHSLTRQFLQENASSVPDFKELVHRMLGSCMSEDAIKGIRVILSALE